jgi:biopolymer transport protein ExbB
MVTAQMPGRTQFLADLAQRRELPTVPELRHLWSAMVTEIAESGKVVKFTATVERTSGEKQDLEIIRLGVFNAVSNGQFLDWDTRKSRVNLIELARQPAARFSSMAADRRRCWLRDYWRRFIWPAAVPVEGLFALHHRQQDVPSIEE